MGFLGKDAQQLHIAAMSMHVVGVDPFVPEPAFAAITEEAFFLDRVVENDVDAIYAFQDDSDVKKLLSDIVSGGLTFEKGAQRLARDFNKAHVATSTDGAFFLLDLRDDEENRFFCLIKYDYNQVLERRHSKGQTRLRRIVQAFVTEKKAVQKICLLAVVNGAISADVAARDRMRTAPELSDYFYKFLGVTRERSAAQMTTAVLDVARHVLSQFKGHLGDRSVAIAMGEVEGAMRQRQKVDAEVMGEILLGVLAVADDEKVQKSVTNAVERRFESARLHGLEFKPDPAALKTTKTVRLETAEGVVIKYSERTGETLVTRTKKPKGGETITIETSGTVVEKLVKVG